jgi:hypothetical protein
VEGQTEEGFVKGLLAPHLQRHSVYANVILVPHKPGARQRKHRGGIGSFAAPREIIKRKLYGDTTAYTTTMFDYYGLPDDFPGLGSSDLPPRYPNRVDYIEKQLALTFGESPRFIPYLQVHEFEALLFSDVETLHLTISALAGGSGARLDELNQLVAQFETPEDIDDGPDTAPSKRLQKYFPGYQKVPFGELIAELIGLDTLRAACPHFDSWVTRLEALTAIA